MGRITAVSCGATCPTAASTPPSAAETAKSSVHGDDGSAAYAVAIQSDGKIVVAGQYNLYGPAHVSRVGVYRFNADGSVDTTFGGGDGIANVGVRRFRPGVRGPGPRRRQDRCRRLQPEKPTAADPPHWTDDARASPSTVALARFNANGTLDTSFSGDGKLMHRIGRRDLRRGPGGAKRRQGRRLRPSLQLLSHVARAGPCCCATTPMGRWTTDSATAAS